MLLSVVNLCHLLFLHLVDLTCRQFGLCKTPNCNPHLCESTLKFFRAAVNFLNQPNGIKSGILWWLTNVQCVPPPTSECEMWIAVLAGSAQCDLIDFQRVELQEETFFYFCAKYLSLSSIASLGEFQLWRKKLRVKSSCCASWVRWWLCGRVQALSADSAELAESTFDQIAALHTLTRGLVKSEEKKSLPSFPSPSRIIVHGEC